MGNKIVLGGEENSWKVSNVSGGCRKRKGLLGEKTSIEETLAFFLSKSGREWEQNWPKALIMQRLRC